MSEMPFCYIHRVYDESKLSSVRKHVADSSIEPIIHEEYTSFYDGMSGEGLSILTWEVKMDRSKNVTDVMEG